MMLALALLLAIVIGGLVGWVISYDAGYVMLHYGDWVVETSVWVAVFGLVLVYLAIRGVLWLFRSLIARQVGIAIKERKSHSTPRIAR